MAKELSVLQQQAEAIKTEVNKGANTSARVGGMFEDMLDFNVASTMEYNVSKFHPTSGIGGTNKYILETAIALVPEQYRSIGIKCSFINEAGNDETWVYKGREWEISSFSLVGTRKLAQLQIRQIVKEIYCQKIVNNINKVAFIRLFNGPQYKQIFLRDAEKNDIDAITLTEDGTTPRGLYKGANTGILYFIENWEILENGEYISAYNIGENNFNIDANPKIKNYLSENKYSTDNDIVNTIVPEIYLYEKKEVNKILLKVLNNKETIQVFLYNNDDIIGSVGYYNSEIPPKVLTLSNNEISDVEIEIGKVALNYEGLKKYVDGSYTFNVVFDKEFANNILNFPIISSLCPSLNPELKPVIDNPALYTEVSSSPIVNAVISEMILPDSIDYSLVRKIRFVNGETFKQIFLQSEDGSINYDAKSIVEDGSTPNGMYIGENIGVIYLINDWSKLPSGTSTYNVTLSKKVTDIAYNAQLKLLYQNSSPSNSFIVNNILKEIYLNNVCLSNEVEGIRLVRNNSKYWQIFFVKNIVNDNQYDVIAGSSLLQGDSIPSGVYDIQGIKLYVDGIQFANFFQQGKIALIKCTLSIKTNDKYNWIEISNYRKKTKEILWLGTSIPAGKPWGNGYPKLVGESLGVKIYNKAIGASFIQYRTDIPSSEADDYKCFSLSQTTEEKESLFGNAIQEWSEEKKEGALNHGYDKLIIPYIDGTIANCDTIIFDHGWNDRDIVRTTYQQIQDETIDMQSRDRNTFVGAFNFLYDKILEANPRVRIIIAGYHENESDDEVGYPGNTKRIGYYGKQLCAVQEYIAKYYGFPLIKMWEKANFTFRQIVPNTINYLQNMGYSRTAHIKDSNGNISVFDYYHPDGIHPYSGEKNGGAMGETYLANIYIQELQGYFLL